MTLRRAVFLGFLILAAVGGNLLHVPLFYGIDLIFGSIAVFLVLRVYGVSWGVVTAAVAASYTYSLWGHPWAIVIFTLEALVVGLSQRSDKPTPLVMADAGFWLLIGVPLIWLFYNQFLGFTGPDVQVILLKQPINGLFNAVVASLLLRHFGIEKKFGASPNTQRSPLFLGILDLLMLSVLLTVLVLASVNSRANRRTALDVMQQDLEETAHDVSQAWLRWGELHLRAVLSAADEIEDLGIGETERIQEHLRVLTEALPMFHNMYVADSRGIITAFYPPVNERGESTIGLDFSDREYFQKLRETHRPVISDVFTGRGGVFEPIVTLSAPILISDQFAGFVLGALNLEALISRLVELVTEGTHITLLDRSGHVAGTTLPNLEIASTYDPMADRMATEMGEGLFQVLPVEEGPAIARWSQSSLLRIETPVEELGWQVVTEASLAPIQQSLFRGQIHALGIALVVVILGLGASYAISRAFSQPIRHLAKVTTDLPDRIMRHEPVELPTAPTREIHQLAINFQGMATSLREYFDALQKRNTELTRSNRELMEQISERRRLEDQFRQLQKMEALGSLAGGIAHDFNNILTAIMGRAEMAGVHLEEEHPASEQIEKLQKAGRQARDLVQQILVFSRHQEQDWKPVEIEDLVSNTLDLVRTGLPSSVEIHTDVHPDVGKVMGNQTQLEQVLLNLCTNAAQAIEDGGELHISAQRASLDREQARAHGLPGAGEYVHIRVRDTGPGIPTQFVSRIFEPFFTTKALGKGTGMGLAVTHGIVTSHHGTIWVDSEPGLGAEFHVLLPSPTTPVPHPVLDQSTTPEGSESILFVDDERMLTELVKEMLESLGYQVEVRNDPQEALRRFEANPARYDLVISDQSMPGLAGNRLIEAMRAKRPDMPAILCTGYSQSIEPKAAKAQGIDAFLYKPLLLTDLAKTIREVLD